MYSCVLRVLLACRIGVMCPRKAAHCKRPAAAVFSVSTWPPISETLWTMGSPAGSRRSWMTCQVGVVGFRFQCCILAWVSRVERQKASHVTVLGQTLTSRCACCNHMGGV